MNDRPEIQDKSVDSLGSRLWDLAFLFLKLGTVSFGGPAAHIALIEQEIVHKRDFVTRKQFLDNFFGCARSVENQPGMGGTYRGIAGFVLAAFHW